MHEYWREVPVHHSDLWVCAYDGGEACGCQDDEFLNGNHDWAFCHDGRPVSHKWDVLGKSSYTIRQLLA